MGYYPAKQYPLATGRTLVVRNPVPDDAPRLLDYAHVVLRESAYFLLEADEFQVTPEEEREWILEHTQDDGQLLLVAEVEAQVVGLAGFENGPQRRVAHRGSLHLSVARPWRGLGIGTVLMESILDWAAQSPLIEKVSLSVMVSNQRAIGLYRKLGFREEGRLVREIKLGPDHYEDELVMSRWIGSGG